MDESTFVKMCVRLLQKKQWVSRKDRINASFLALLDKGIKLTLWFKQLQNLIRLSMQCDDLKILIANDIPISSSLVMLVWGRDGWKYMCKDVYKITQQEAMRKTERLNECFFSFAFRQRNKVKFMIRAIAGFNQTLGAV